MKKRIKILFLLLLLLISSLLFIQMTYAETEEDLSLEVAYDELSCGKDITFQINANGGNGEYKYRIYYFRQKLEDGSTYDVIDPTKFQYQTSNEFKLSFYATGTYMLRFTVFGKVNGTYQTKNKDITINLNDSNYPTVEEKAKSIISIMNKKGYKTDFEKALFLHDYLIDICKYDYSYKYCNAEGALCRGTGTCEAYHRAYSMLLNLANIPNGRSESAKANHVWTSVKLDGKWYQVDVTHDDYGSDNSFYRHLYFGLPESITRLSSLNRSDFTGNSSEAFTNNYFIKTGKIKDWSDIFLTEIQSKIDEKSSDFELDVTSTDPPSVKDILYNLVAYELGTYSYKANGKNVTINFTYDSTNLKLKANATYENEKEVKEEEQQSKEEGKDETKVKEEETIEEKEDEDDDEEEAIIEPIIEDKEEEPIIEEEHNLLIPILIGIVILIIVTILILRKKRNN